MPKAPKTIKFGGVTYKRVDKSTNPHYDDTNEKIVSGNQPGVYSFTPHNFWREGAIKESNNLPETLSPERQAKIKEIRQKMAATFEKASSELHTIEREVERLFVIYEPQLMAEALYFPFGFDEAEVKGIQNHYREMIKGFMKIQEWLHYYTPRHK